MSQHPLESPVALKGRLCSEFPPVKVFSRQAPFASPEVCSSYMQQGYQTTAETARSNGCDRKNINDGQMTTRLQAFLEMLEANR